MSLTNRQKTLLHVVPGQLAIPDCDRKTIQRNVGGFTSAADRDATHEGFAAVMAHYERTAGGELPSFTPGFWAAAHGRNEREGGGTAGRLRYAIGRQAANMGWTPNDVDEFLAGKHCSDGKCQSTEDVTAYWLSRCLNGMRAIAERSTLKPQGVTP